MISAPCAALTAIRAQVEGRQLPGYRWVPLRQRRERKRRFFAALHWFLLLAGAVMAAWALAYLDEESLGMRALLILFGLIGMGAGLAQIVGRPLCNPWDGEAT